MPGMWERGRPPPSDEDQGVDDLYMRRVCGIDVGSDDHEPAGSRPYYQPGHPMSDAWCQVCGETQYMTYKWACSRDHFFGAYEIGLKQ